MRGNFERATFSVPTVVSLNLTNSVNANLSPLNIGFPLEFAVYLRKLVVAGELVYKQQFIRNEALRSGVWYPDSGFVDKAAGKFDKTFSKLISKIIGDYQTVNEEFSNSILRTHAMYRSKVDGDFENTKNIRLLGQLLGCRYAYRPGLGDIKLGMGIIIEYSYEVHNEAEELIYSTTIKTVGNESDFREIRPFRITEEQEEINRKFMVNGILAKALERNVEQLFYELDSRRLLE